MSYGTRDYVKPGAPMYRAAGYDAAGNCVRSVGPYATKGAAMGQRGTVRGRAVVRVCVEVCEPSWAPIPGTEVER
ncbi:hypothetical protein DER29_0497 [Micromonospora sp. M71_S20]|uniref:hypothetical protein n=1 Tax=Micromonospora sp. M71_S20 TaxID=592872 RepID=UPI000EAF110B|nr:hypothetical protein [Micromonospora sp. M71_S20]RLK22659.1 hypothetical protein DER29_0497 [Micromonospora sp. M71_S20]